MFLLSLAVLIVAAIGCLVAIHASRDTGSNVLVSLICVSFTCIAIACLIAGMRGAA